MKKNKLIGMCLCLLAPFSCVQADDDIKYDYIIVGNGSAGSILARKLSDNHHKKVLVLEAGVNHNDDPLALATYFNPLIFDIFGELTNDPEYANTYIVPNSLESFVRKEGGAPTQIYSEGKGWGGGSMHNGMIAVRGTPQIYDYWAAFSGNDQWSYDNMLPLMLALENYTPCADVSAAPVDLDQRGVGGPISITQLSTVVGDPLTTLLAAGTNSGFTTDYNDATVVSTTGHLNLGISPTQGFATSAPGCTVGMRSWSSREFLTPDVVTPSGKGVGRLLHIESNCYVSRVLFHGKKAKGVEFVFGKNGTHSSKAYGKKIILCAGPISSPAILQRSGIGDAELLDSLGIDVIVDNPNVGANLNNQYGYTTLVNVPTTAFFGEVFANGSASPALAAPYAYPNDDTRRIQMILVPISGTVSSIYNIMVETQSHGSVQIGSTNQFVYPDIDLGMYTDNLSATPYTVHGTDANLALANLKVIAQSVGVGNMIAPPAAAFASDAALFTYVTSADGLAITYHIVGTTRMAQSMVEGVVDGNLNVFGVENLMVADTGVLPVPPDGNTCYSAYMVGLRAAAILGADTPPAL